MTSRYTVSNVLHREQLFFLIDYSYNLRAEVNKASFTPPAGMFQFWKIPLLLFGVRIGITHTPRR
jgi:hypothetical protein